jgi:hypothetical protein
MLVCEQSDNIPKSLAISWSKHILLQQVHCCKDKCLCPTSSYLTCWQIVIDVLSLVVGACALNQSRGHWLWNDALHFVITMKTKLMEILENPLALTR